MWSVCPATIEKILMFRRSGLSIAMRNASVSSKTASSARRARREQY
jgi:hypothetical protein